MEDRCVCCGEIVPEGRMVCPNCEAHISQLSSQKVTKGDTYDSHFSPALDRPLIRWVRLLLGGNPEHRQK